MSQASAVDAYSMRTYGSHTSFLGMGMILNMLDALRFGTFSKNSIQILALLWTLRIYQIRSTWHLPLPASYDGVRLLLTEPVDVTWRERARDIMLLGFEN